MLVAQDAMRPGFFLALSTRVPTGTVSGLPMATGFGRVRRSSTLSNQARTYGDWAFVWFQMARLSGVSLPALR